MTETLGVSACLWWNSLHDLGAPLTTSALFSQVLSSSG